MRATLTGKAIVPDACAVRDRIATLGAKSWSLVVASRHALDRLDR
jgi:hypothetical protein